MANRRRIPTEQEPEIRRLHGEGHSGALIARRLGVPQDTLYRKLKEMGLEVHRHGRRSGLSSKEIQELCAAYQNGATTQELGERHGISATTVGDHLRTVGIELRPAGFRRGPDHHGWKGGRLMTPQGYVMALIHEDDPFFSMAQKKADGAHYVLEHRLVMARQLGRPLEEHETVHHIDGDRQNNAPENLQLRQGKHGKGAVLRCGDCGSHNILHVPLN